MLAGDAIPRIADGVLHLFPCRVTAVLIRVPRPRQIWFDLVPLAAAITIRRFVAVAIPRLVIVVVLAGRDVRTRVVVASPVCVFVVPIETICSFSHCTLLGSFSLAMTEVQ